MAMVKYNTKRFSAVTAVELMDAIDRDLNVASAICDASYIACTNGLNKNAIEELLSHASELIGDAKLRAQAMHEIAQGDAAAV